MTTPQDTDTDTSMRTVDAQAHEQNSEQHQQQDCANCTRPAQPDRLLCSLCFVGGQRVGGTSDTVHFVTGRNDIAEYTIQEYLNSGVSVEPNLHGPVSMDEYDRQQTQEQAQD